MPRMIGSGLSRREREILEVLHRLKKASVGEVEAALPDAPSYSAVRTLLRILEEKGHVQHLEEGRRYVYVSTQPHLQAARLALKNVVQTFFGGSLESAVQAFLSEGEPRPSDTAFEQRVEQMAERIKKIHRDQELERREQRQKKAMDLRAALDALNGSTEEEKAKEGQEHGRQELKDAFQSALDTLKKESDASR